MGEKDLKAGHDTVLLPAASAAATNARSIIVVYQNKGGIVTTQEHTEKIVVGRDESCQVRLDDDVVSRFHVEIYPSPSGWWVRDLDSTNGVLLNGERIKHAQLAKTSLLNVGVDGPLIRLLLNEERGAEAAKNNPALEDAIVTQPNQLSTDKPALTVSQVLKKYAEGPIPKRAGQLTRIFRQAFVQVKKSQSRRYRVAVAAALGLLLICLLVVFILQVRLNNLHQTAIDLFYQMKALEVQWEKMQDENQASGNQAAIAGVGQQVRQLQELQDRYDRFVDELGILTELSDEDRIIYRMARVFGECELNISQGFVDQVKDYIQRWRSTTRLKQTLQHLEEKGFAPTVFRIMLSQHLPPQFLYIALQESDFREEAIGPKTRYGIAKGIWQILPSTAVQYGLKVGPLLELPVFDPRDERFQFEKSTQAAVKYLRYIYTTEAQASGLLVIASYNWGHNAVRRRIREMPDDPRERNFWNLMVTFDIPQETRDYVYYIFSAAVILDNPGLFGFDLKNPLETLTIETQPPDAEATGVK